MRAGLMRSTFFVENQRQTVALNMYYSVSTALCVFAKSPSLQRYSWNASKENGGEKIIFAHVDGAWVFQLLIFCLLTSIQVWFTDPYSVESNYQSTRLCPQFVMVAALWVQNVTWIRIHHLILISIRCFQLASPPCQILRPQNDPSPSPPHPFV